MSTGFFESSFTRFAGALLQACGWAAIAAMLPVLAFLLLAAASSQTHFDLTSIWPLGSILFVGVVSVLTGRALRGYAKWARWLALLIALGTGLASLLYVPYIALASALLLYFLLRGWRETGAEEAGPL